MGATTDGAQREDTISQADKVMERLEAAAAKAATTADEQTTRTDATVTETTPPAPVQAEVPVETVQTDDDVVEYEAGGVKRRLDWKELRSNPGAKQAFVEQLRRGAEPARPQVDQEQVVQLARRMQIEADIDRGYLRVNPATGQLEETPRGRMASGGAVEEAPRPRDEGDLLGYLSETERKEYRTLREAGINGDLDAFERSDRLVALSGRRAASKDSENLQRQFQQTLQQRDSRAWSEQNSRNNLDAVNREMAKHGDVFGAYDPATGRFADERRAQLARNTIAAVMEKTQKATVDQVHLGQIAIVADSYRGGVAPAPQPNNPSTQRQQTAPPPSVGRGSRVPPGPPPQQRQPGAPANQGDPTRPQRPKMGSPEMVNAVADRLRQLASN